MHLYRYQLTKRALSILKSGNPQIFSGHISSAVESLPESSFLQLFDGNNKIAGYGVLAKKEKISIRVLAVGEKFSASTLKARLQKLMAQKTPLLAVTDAFRLVNGESDLFPGLTLDIYAGHAVIQLYSPSMLKIARYLSLILPQIVPFPILSIQLRAASKIGSSAPIKSRVTRGSVPANVIIREFHLQYEVDLQKGQKGGFFLDLRPAREKLLQLDLKGLKVLNLFAYTGAFSVIALKRGALSVVSVEQSATVSNQAKSNLALNGLEASLDKRSVEDAFLFLGRLPENEKFDLIIVDPPCLASKVEQIPLALKKIDELYDLAARHLNSGGYLLGCCCTQKIEKNDLIQRIGSACKAIFGKGKTQLLADLNQPLDHKPAKHYPEGQYLKQLLFQVGE